MFGCGKLSEKDLPVSERLLLILHNLCATDSSMAKKSDELAQVLQIDTSEVDNLLKRHESEGYAKSFTDNEGNKRYYLTSIGIIKVCSVFT
jgi:DNA-binding MarR family transcriptional regulator